MYKLKQRNFTLAEILIVMVIIAIIATFAVNSISRSVRIGRSKELYAEYVEIRSALGQYQGIVGDFPASCGSDKGDLPQPEEDSGIDFEQYLENKEIFASTPAGGYWTYRHNTSSGTAKFGEVVLEIIVEDGFDEEVIEICNSTLFKSDENKFVPADGGKSYTTTIRSAHYGGE